MFGRLKLALVALVLMPSAAFAADQAPRHAPGATVEAPAVATKVAAPSAEAAEPSRKHRSPAKFVQNDVSTIGTFLDRLRAESVASGPSGTKQTAAAVSAVAAPTGAGRHQPG